MPNSPKPPPPLADCVTSNLQHYIHGCGDQKITGVYKMVLTTIEKPVLELTMQHCGGNQSAAADFLGLNRNTLRKKLLEHKLIAE
jgi:Fis family transcriptional regulator, factor for inversion stimulation protein